MRREAAVSGKRAGSGEAGSGGKRRGGGGAVTRGRRAAPPRSALRDIADAPG